MRANVTLSPRHLVTLLTALILTTNATRACADVRYLEDATLRAVQFIDANEGWAVGDAGVIWHTINGGKNWELQHSGVRGSLRSVCFVTPFRGEGWIAGREELPHGGSIGILLQTRDGGVTWRRQLTNGLPGLNVVRFTADPRVGFLLGDGCDAFASGVFKTTDAGKHWEPVPGPRASTWFAGDFRDEQNGILCGAWSRLAMFTQNGFSVADVDKMDGRRAILGMQVLPQRLLAVGQGGLVLSSSGDSAGRKWGEVDTGLPPEVRANVDFHAIHSVGPRVWIVGRPGTFVLASDNQGVNWKMLKTGQPMPLHGLYFLDQRGWAVGEAGTILSTNDGGQSWIVQQQGGKRAAILCVHARPEKLDIDTLAGLGADEGHLTVALRCTVPAAGSSWNHSMAAQRFAAGTRLAGGMTGETLWQFPLPQYLAASDKKRIFEYWNELHVNEADQQILRQLVLALRMWRPSVVIGDAPHPQISGSPVASMMCEALQAALVQSSDPKAFPEQIDQLGLRPWRVSRYYAGWDNPTRGAGGPPAKTGEQPRGAGGPPALTVEPPVPRKDGSTIVIDANKVTERLEKSFREFASPASRILTDSQDPLPLQRYYRLLGNAPDVNEAKLHMLEGLQQTTGESRRELRPLTIGKSDMDKIRSLSNFVLLAEKLKNPNQILAQLGPMLDSVPVEHGADAALNVAHHFAQQGQWLLAQEAYLLLVQKFPTTPQSAEAYRWLIRYSSSSEARRRQELGQFMMQTNMQFNAKNLGKPPMGDDANPANPAKPIAQPIAQVNFLANPNEARHWYRGSLEHGNRIAALGPMYALDPELHFCVQSSRRQLGDIEPVKDYFTRFVNFFPRGPWHDAANTELWLIGRGGMQVKPIGTCRWAAQKPVLDGDCGDPCWQKLKPFILQNAAGDTNRQYPTQAWMAFDQEFLYLALRCEHPAGQQVTPVKNRKRDADLDAFDRVSIMLDLDRDYSTYFHLQVDQRGCVRDDCWGDLSWNPKWFVAVKSTPTVWCVEAAIPLNELTGEKVTPSTSWACNVVRILPGRGVQAWSLPADVQPRAEGMGVLQFVGK